MNAKTIKPRRAVLGLALGLGLATIFGITGLVRADDTANANGATNFVCHAQPGGWCDLRDWNGFDKAF